MKRGGVVAIVLLALALASCATQPGGHHVGDPQSFILGLLHGFIALFSLIGSLFSDVRVYAYPNGGIWYDCGFVVGAALFFGGGAGGMRR